MIIAIALAMLFQEVFLIGLTGEYRGVAPFTPGSFEIAGVAVLYQHLYSIGISLVMIVGVWIMLRATKLGKAIRAVAEDREIANLMGINVSQVSLIVMGISTALAGVAGIAVAPIFMVHPLMWVHPMIIVLAVVVLGGLQSIKGSIIAAFILGFAEVLVISLIPKGSFLRGAVSLSVMAVVLMLRPEGLFGIVFEEERL
jgi:branched-chain amino acid transport system permease protein